MVAPTVKKSQGRRKIEIKKLSDESQKQVTFSKRRAGLFKKAAELAVLCDSQVAVVAFSPGDKCYCFGHPNVQAVVDGFIDGQECPGAASLPEGVHELNGEYAAAARELEVEKERAAAIKAGRCGCGGFWWEKEVGGMEVEELECYMAALQELKCNVESKLGSSGAAAAAGRYLTHQGGGEVGGLVAHGFGDLGFGQLGRG